ncbi:MAG: UbiA family prenyltransferase [Flavobacteriales bacterium]|nr:UbiA family prenyltransferase [Flavobacteriales bacterium]MCB9204192.1 UbiA family prenyltransferase [Flavobacteriales bacterium]
MSGLSKFVRYAKSLRLAEAFLMTGFSMVALLFVDSFPSEISLIQITRLFSGVFVYVLTIYFLNSYCDYKADVISDRLSHVAKVSKHGYKYLFVLFSLLTVFCWFWFTWTSGILCAVGVCLWALYYAKPLRLKESIFLGTMVHLVAGMVHYLIVMWAVTDVGVRSLSVAGYFGLLLATGHLNHELLDYKFDKAAGVRTMAVRLGVRNNLNLRVVMSILVVVYSFMLYRLSIVPTEIHCPLQAANMVMLLISLRGNSCTPSIFQKITRLAFLIAISVALVYKILVQTT